MRLTPPQTQGTGLRRDRLLERLTLDEPGAASAELSAGDLALLPHGSGHLIQDDRDSPARSLEHILAELPAEAAERLAYGGDGPRTSLLCGGFALASGLPENLLSLLPPLLVLDTADTGISRWLEPTVFDTRTSSR